MATALRAIFALFASIATLVAVVAIKRGVEWELRDASDAFLNFAVLATVGPLVAAGAWLWIARPLIDRRKQREQAGLRQGTVRDVSGD